MSSLAAMEINDMLAPKPIELPADPAAGEDDDPVGETLGLLEIREEADGSRGAHG